MDHERMIGEVNESLLAKYKSAGDDAHSDLDDRDHFYNPVVDERPTRDGGNHNRHVAPKVTP
jgi:hypothetical protein